MPLTAEGHFPRPIERERKPDDFAGLFAAPLLAPDRADPANLTEPGGSERTMRYAVYRNNVASSLVKAIEDIYPATRRIVGPEFFRGMAIGFVRLSPPRSRVLSEYGRDFPAFIEGFGPARPMPYLADVARLERAWLDAYHAADAEPLAQEALAGLPPERLAAACFVPHPAMRLVRSNYAIVSIFQSNRGEPGMTGRIRGDVAEDALVTRPRATVEVRRLEPGCAVFFGSLAGGHSLARSVEEALDEEPAFDAGQAIALTLEAGAFAAVEDE